MPRDAHTPPISFGKLQIRLPKGTDVGRTANHEYGCLLFGMPVSADIVRGQVSNAELKESFENALEPMGYDIIASPNAFYFEEEYEDEILRTEYKVAARLVDLDLDSCARDPGFAIFSYNKGGFRGKMHAVYEWSVFDNIQKTTVYKMRTSGYVDRKQINPQGIALMMLDTFEMAAHNLGADQRFYDLMVRGVVPEKTWLKSHKDHEERPRKYNVNEAVHLPHQALSQKPLSDFMSDAQSNSVIVQGGAGHGSGFFITNEGHILTNEHVVGNARRVRVLMSGKKQKLSAEVLRTDKTRDIAILRLESKPQSMNFSVLPVRLDWPKVGEEIYVIGAPLTTRLQDTVTKGIVSAHRPAFKIFGVKVDMIQADVAVQGGNSGGPMLDRHGNIVGVTVASTVLSGGNEALNYFIPIQSALNALDIKH